MHMILRYPTGRRVESVLLAAGAKRMRLAIRSLNETIELHQEDEEGQWKSEDGYPVEIESVVWDGQSAVPPPYIRVLQRTLRAGG